jgi:hypothetical protein
MLESVAPFGSIVSTGDTLARIYAFDKLEQEPRIVTAPT